MDYNEKVWYFPSGKNLEKTSASNAYVETFNDKKLESLSREICQNSLDAKDDTESPVKVKFSIIEINTKTIPGVKEFSKEIIPLADKTWFSEKKTQRLISKMKKILSGETVRVLKISDENTTGLEPNNWESLIEQAGSSVKNSDDSGGSFGIGKAAPFAISDLRMVFYNTLTNNSIQQSIGVTKFVSYDLPNGETTQGTGYFGESEKKPFVNGVDFDKNIRIKKGTDIYVMGFDTENYYDWKNEIIYSVLDNFLISIYNDMLEVEVEGKVLTRSSISEYIKKIRMDKKLTRIYSDVLSYYEVLHDEGKVVVSMPGFEKYRISDGEAKLFLSNKTDNNRKVLMTRKAGMKIFDKNRISGILKFSGIFQAVGGNVNKVLKDLENPNHDKWSVDRADNKEYAKEFLDHITKFIKDAVTDNYQEKIMKEVDAFGLSDFLPSKLSEIIGKNKSENNESGIDRKMKIILKDLKQPKSESTIVRAEENGELTDQELKKSGIIEGETSGSGFDNGLGGGLGIGDNKFGVGFEEGHNGTDADIEDDILVESRKPIKKITEINYRIIEKDSKEGHYIIVLNPKNDITDVNISLNIIGDSGNKSRVRIVSATIDGSHDIKTKSNSFFLNALKANIWNSIDIVLLTNTRLKLEAEVYANFE